MPRLKIIFPEKFLASFLIPVRITDLNYGNHVGNDAFVSIIHEARMQFLKSHGFTELDVDGVGLIMSDIAVEFKSESFYGDEIKVEIGVDEIADVRFSMYYRLTARRGDKDVLLAKARTGMVCFDYGEKKVVVIPKKLRHIIS